MHKAVPLGHNEAGQVFVSESGLCTFITRSKMPEAKLFQRWVTKDAIPIMHKTSQSAATIELQDQDNMQQGPLQHEIVMVNKPGCKLCLPRFRWQGDICSKSQARLHALSQSMIDEFLRFLGTGWRTTSVQQISSASVATMSSRFFALQVSRGKI